MPGSAAVALIPAQDSVPSHGLILPCADEVRVLVALDHVADLRILDHQDCLRLIVSVNATMVSQPTVGLILLIAQVDLLKPQGFGLEQEALVAVALLCELLCFAQVDGECELLKALSVVLKGPGHVIIVIRVFIVIAVIIVVIIVMIGMSVIIVIVVNIVIT